MAMNDPVYDIPLGDNALPSNPASDPLYDTDTDFTEAPPTPSVGLTELDDRKSDGPQALPGPVR
jgi:hypothetical protein